MDLNINAYSKQAIVHLVNGTDPFTKFKKGDKINHAMAQIGEVEYLSHDHAQGYVEVKTKEDRIVKYDEDKFLGKNNDLENPKTK